MHRGDAGLRARGEIVRVVLPSVELTERGQGGNRTVSERGRIWAEGSERAVSNSRQDVLVQLHPDTRYAGSICKQGSEHDGWLGPLLCADRHCFTENACACTDLSVMGG